jgi:hypothetical protein
MPPPPDPYRQSSIKLLGFVPQWEEILTADEVARLTSTEKNDIVLTFIKALIQPILDYSTHGFLYDFKGMYD